jgi:hypothetical protein
LKEISLHLLDIAENSVAAGARCIEMTVDEDVAGNRMRLCVQDDGRGMDRSTLHRVEDPFVTGRTTRVAGFGIPLLKEAAEACNGTVRVHSEPGVGTRVEAEFEWDHIDRMPLGDLVGTWFTLIVGQPHVRWLFRYRINGKGFTFDSQPVSEVLGDVPLTEPSVLGFIRRTLQDGIQSAQREAAEQTPASILAHI